MVVFSSEAGLQKLPRHSGPKLVHELNDFHLSLTGPASVSSAARGLSGRVDLSGGR